MPFEFPPLLVFGSFLLVVMLTIYLLSGYEGFPKEKSISRLNMIVFIVFVITFAIYSVSTAKQFEIAIDQLRTIKIVAISFLTVALLGYLFKLFFKIPTQKLLNLFKNQKWIEVIFKFVDSMKSRCEKYVTDKHLSVISTIAITTLVIGIILYGISISDKIQIKVYIKLFSTAVAFVLLGVDLTLNIASKCFDFKRIKSHRKLYITATVGVCILLLYGILTLNFVEWYTYFFPKATSPRGEMIEVLLKIGGGIAIFYGLIINNKRTKAMDRNNELTEKGTIDERFKSGIEHLASDKQAIVIGGIYTLHQIAKDNREYRKQIFETLCGYLRATKRKTSTTNNNKTGESQVEPHKGEDLLKPIFQTIVDLLFREDKAIYSFKANLVGADLSGLDLMNADLSNANLWKADLREADLSHSNLRNADLSEADLRQAFLVQAKLRQAFLVQAKLRQAKLREVDLRKAHLMNANLSKADLRQADLIEANLRHSNLMEADLRQANLSHSNLMEADLRQAFLVQADLRDVDLLSANLWRANLRQVDLRRANLVSVDLRQTNLLNANLMETDLRGANLIKANLSEAKLENTILIDGKLEHIVPVDIDLSGAVMTEEEFRALPEGVKEEFRERGIWFD